MKIFLDSCLIIYLLEGQTSFSQPVEATILAEPEAEYCASALVRMECLIGPLRSGNTALLAEYGKVFQALTLLPISDEVYEKAAHLRATHNLKTPDALHLATALEAGCDEFWTNDTRLSKAGAAITFKVLP